MLAEIGNAFIVPIATLQQHEWRIPQHDIEPHDKSKHPLYIKKASGGVLVVRCQRSVKTSQQRSK